MKGRGMGFRGSSPSAPYVGIGRGGKPRCQSPEVAGAAGSGLGLRRGRGPASRQASSLSSLEARLVSLRAEIAEVEEAIGNMKKETKPD
jgi:hypothetical protein